MRETKWKRGKHIWKKWLWTDNGFDCRRCNADKRFMITMLASKMLLKRITYILWHQMRIKLLNILLPTEIISLSQKWQVCGLFFGEVQRASITIRSLRICYVKENSKGLHKSRIFLFNHFVFCIFTSCLLTFLIPSVIHKHT